MQLQVCHLTPDRCQLNTSHVCQISRNCVCSIFHEDGFIARALSGACNAHIPGVQSVSLNVYSSSVLDVVELCDLM